MPDKKQDDLFSSVSELARSIDALMKSEIVVEDVELKKSVGRIASEFASWLDFEFRVALRNKYPELAKRLEN